MVRLEYTLRKKP